MDILFLIYVDFILELYLTQHIDCCHCLAIAGVGYDDSGGGAAGMYYLAVSDVHGYMGDSASVAVE